MPNTIYVSINGTGSTDSTFGGALTTVPSNYKSITAATKATYCQLTVTAHGLSVGDWIYVTSVGGMTQLNGFHHQVYSIVDVNNFTINTNSTGYSTYTSGGYAYMYPVTQTNPCHVRRQAHGYSVGQVVYFSGIAGMTNLNGNYYTISAVDGVDTFSINVDASAFPVYSSGGSVRIFNRYIQNITQANPAVVTANNHGLSNGAKVFIQGVGGMTQVNGKTFTIGSVATNTFQLTGVDSSGFSAFTSGGEVHWMRNTIAQAISDAFDGDEIRVEKTTVATTINGGITFTWTNNNNVVGISGATSGIAVGDFIGFSTSAGNGNPLTYYRVEGVSSSTITLRSKVYLGESTSSLVELGCKKIDPVATGNSGARIGDISKNIVLQGGYTLADNTAPVRNSETWVKHAYPYSTSTNLGIYLTASGAVMRYMNIADCYHCTSLTASGTELSYSTLQSGYYYTVNGTTTTSNLNNIMVNSPYISYSTSSITGPLGANCYFISNTAAANAAIVLSGTGYSFNNGIVRCSSVGVISNGYLSESQNFDIRFCSTGIQLNNRAGQIIKNNTIKDGSIGVYVGAIHYDSIIENNTIQNMTSYGVYLTQSHNIIVRDNSFINCVYSGYQDQYTGNNFFINNDHTAPVTAGYSKGALNSGTMTIIGDTIDDSSRFKAIQILASSYNLSMPQYKLQEAFGQTGHYFANHQITRISGASPYTEFQFNSTVNAAKFPYRILGTFVKEGVAKQITYELNAPASISGLSITPSIRLNGTLLQTETAITTVSTGNTWDNYVITVPALSIDQDGELELDLGINAGSGILRLRVIDVVDV